MRGEPLCERVPWVAFHLLLFTGVRVTMCVAFLFFSSFHLLFDGSSTGSVKKKSSPLNSPTPRNELCNMKVSKDFGNNFESS